MQYLIRMAETLSSLLTLRKESPPKTGVSPVVSSRKAFEQYLKQITTFKLNISMSKIYF